PLAAEPAATTRPPDRTPLLEELARFRLENAALRLENGALWGGEHRPAAPHPRAGSPAGADLGQFLAAALVGSSPGTSAAESAAFGREAGRPAQTAGGLPRDAGREPADLRQGVTQAPGGRAGPRHDGPAGASRWRIPGEERADGDGATSDRWLHHG